MAKVLGLDLGSNSLGWALIDKDETRIEGAGVRIFPAGVNIDPFGKEEPKNVQRRNARLIRRQYHRYKLRRIKLLKLMDELKFNFDLSKLYTTYELYELRKRALDEKLNLQELGRIFFHINQRRGFLSNRKTDIVEGSDTGVVKTNIKELEQKIIDSGARTLGEYFFYLIETNKDSHNPDEPNERIRNRYTSRKMYENEFDAIWNFQKNFYAELLTGSKEEKYSIVSGKKKKTNYQRIKNECIFYQRPLKSQKGLVSKCRFEPSKRVAPKSSFVFQEFRIWQKLEDIRVTYAPSDRFLSPLTQDEKYILFNQLQENEKLGMNDMKEAINLPKSRSVKINLGDDDDKLLGNRTNARFINLFGKDEWDKKTEEERNKLWHTYLFAVNDEWLFEYAINYLGFDEDMAKKYLDLGLEADYGSMSQKAMKNILTNLTTGMDYASACKEAGYHHSFDEEKEKKDRKLTDKITPLKNNELRNPIVQQAVSEGIRLVNAVIKKHGKPEEVRIEFTRELKKPKLKREEMRNKNNDKAKQRIEYCNFLNEKKIFDKTVDPKSTEVLKFELWLELGCDKEDVNGFKKGYKFLKRDGNEKFRLWLECDRISPYTGKPISLSQLFHSDIEIDHIIPYSDSMDDSFINKVLAEKKENHTKGNRLPHKYFAETKSRDDWNSFVQRLKGFNNMPEEKIRRMMMDKMPDDFMNNQLNNTAYAAKELKTKMMEAISDVRITSGAVTSKLRKLWGLNSILNKAENEKTREDHRHHAIDALVIACTTNSVINKINRDSQFNEWGKLRVPDFKQPWLGFKEEAESEVNNILISYRKSGKLMQSKPNYLPNGKIQITKSVRGELHQATNFGRITLPSFVGKHDAGIKMDVIRKEVKSFTTRDQVNKVIDPVVREILLARIDEMGLGENVSKAFADLASKPIYMKSTKGLKVPINKVRVIDDNDFNRIKIRKDQELYVSSGNNHLVEIYENLKTGKRNFEVISFYDSVKGEHISSIDILKHKLLFTLTHNELVYMPDIDEKIELTNNNSIFKKLYKVVKFTNKRIYFTLHNISKDTIDNDRIKVENSQDGRSIKHNCIKVKGDILGNIFRIS